jgi:stage II sporulation protein AB (anti-sigma F factor)
MENNMKLEFDAKSQNESLARIVVAAFLTETDPTIEEMNDIKTAVSEAVTNSIIHGYMEGEGKIQMTCKLIKKVYEETDTYRIYNTIIIEIKDEGVGIEDIEKAREPLFTTKPELERSGMGFMFMEMFMDKVEVQSEVGKGTTITMEKRMKKTKKKV